MDQLCVFVRHHSQLWLRLGSHHDGYNRFQQRLAVDLIIREADWLRAMDNWGDSVFLLSFVLFLLLSTLPICLAFAAVWAPEMDAKNADASRR